MARPVVQSGNAGIEASSSAGYHYAYDRGELLWLIAANVTRRGADLLELAGQADLTEAEIADVRTMID